MVGYCGGVCRRGDAGGYALCVGLLGLVRSLLVGRLCWLDALLRSSAGLNVDMVVFWMDLG
jgi:hypothetical protein